MKEREGEGIGPGGQRFQIDDYRIGALHAGHPVYNVPCSVVMRHGELVGREGHGCYLRRGVREPAAVAS